MLEAPLLKFVLDTVLIVAILIALAVTFETFGYQLPPSPVPPLVSS
jgi:hypothetical protein